MGFINILYTINIQFKDFINPIVGTFSKWIDDHSQPWRARIQIHSYKYDHGEHG